MQAARARASRPRPPGHDSPGGVPVVGVQKTTIHTFTVEGEEKNEGILLANSKSLSFSALIFGKAQERLDWELKFKRWGHR